MRKTARGLLPALVVIGLLLADVASAAQIATLAGVVRDQTEGALPGVTVTVRSTATGAVRTTSTDANGRYRVTALDPGEYEVRAELASFRTVVRTGVILTVGGTTEANIAMSLGAVAETMTVVTEPPLIQPSAVELSRVVTALEPGLDPQSAGDA